MTVETTAWKQIDKFTSWEFQKSRPPEEQQGCVDPETGTLSGKTIMSGSEGSYLGSWARLPEWG